MSGAHGQPLSEHFANFERRSAEINALWNKYMATNLSEEEKRLATDFASKRSAWISRARPLFERIKAEDYAPEVSRALLATTLDEGKAVREALDALAIYQAKTAKALFEEEQRDFRTDLIVLALVGLGGLLGLGVYAWWLARTITHPINQAVSVAEAIANGELNRPVPTGGRDEAGRLLAAFALMQDSLRTMVSASQRSADDLACAAIEMSTAAQASAAATTAQSEAASGMAAAVEKCRFPSIRCAIMPARPVMWQPVPARPHAPVARWCIRPATKCDRWQRRSTTRRIRFANWKITPGKFRPSLM